MTNNDTHPKRTQLDERAMSAEDVDELRAGLNAPSAGAAATEVASPRRAEGTL